jgi:hypothetical protein
MDRFIQTTLTVEDKAASFLFVEHFDTDGLAALRTDMDISILRRMVIPEFPPARDDPSYREEHILGMAASVIDDPFMRKTEPVVAVGWHKKLPWAVPLLEEERVIIAQSPPVQVSFRSLARQASGAFIGAALAYEALGTAPPALLFVTVPFGMIICSAAVGLSRGLEAGLYHWLLGAFGVEPEEPQPKRSRRSSPRRKLLDRS